MRKILFCSLLVILGNIACEDEARTIPEISGVQQAEVWVDSRDGKSYDCIEIGDQIWLAENLSYFVVENEILNCYSEPGMQTIMSINITLILEILNTLV